MQNNVMRVQEMIAQAEPLRLAQAMRTMFPHLDVMSEKTDEQMAESITGLQERLAKIETSPCDDYIIVATPTFSVDLDDAHTAHIRIGSSAWPPDELTHDRDDDPCKAGYSYSLYPWAKVLGMRCWIPPEMCDAEADEFVADMLCELTAFCDEEGDAGKQKIRADLERTIEESQTEKAKTSSMTFDEMCEKYGFERPPKRKRDHDRRLIAVWDHMCDVLGDMMREQLAELAEILEADD